ncbi:TonB-linked SusC/RagA family outer membrane protein [Chitinophaga niastensis]|uniref:TonB-linked SusC/RagA family outer membrane protein n=1 Tax=Chitinophaga niastensis TaxID=536980 RepID=A0A2P8HGS1_CHINA|nr:TonB-dependent receptor [Chitinophaga niastensis]PSL45417.1 TonB-linked SusC/RagA family outer membrane protein [Chitinophaga niastensis]
MKLSMQSQKIVGGKLCNDLSYSSINQPASPDRKGHWVKVLLRTTKITGLLIFAICIQVRSEAYSQQITLKRKNASLKSVLKEIHSQTGYELLYSEEVIDLSVPVSVNFNHIPLKAALDQIFISQPLTYSIEEKTILISEKEKKTINNINTYFSSIDVTGTVSDENNLPLPGASVRVKGTDIAVITGRTGAFNLKNVPENSTLVISFIGYITQEVKAQKDMGNIKLTITTAKLGELIVVGYGTQERRDLTGSIGKLSGATVATQPVESFDKALAGRITGVLVTQSSGILGDPPTIRIRGTNSLTSGNNPLYVLDGVPIVTSNSSSIIPTNPLGDINPSDIESIEVLKDGSASAIYGSRAASGVVLITTKKGVKGKTAVNYDSWVGISQIGKRYKMLDADQFIQISNEKFTNAGLDPQAFPTLGPDGKPYNTDWQKVIFRTAYSHNHNLSLSGGTDKSNYYFSAGFTDLQGVTVDNSLRKYTVMGKVEQKALNIFTFGLNTAISYVQNNGLNTDPGAISGNVGSGLVLFPNVPVYNPDGSYNITGNALGRGANKIGIANDLPNMKAVLDNNVYRNQSLTINGNAFVSVKIIDGLTVRSQLGINAKYGEDYNYWNPLIGDGQSTNGYIYQQYNPSFNYVWTNNLSYNKTLDRHHIGVVAGTEFQKTRIRNFNASGTGLSNIYFGPENLISGTVANQFVGGDITENAISSYFGRVNYSFSDRYLLTLTYRSDRLSSLGPNSKATNLPGVSVGWRLSDEGFFKKSSTLAFINELKIRASYAKTGNADIGNYPFANIYAPNTYGSQNGVSYSTFGNQRLTFETSNKYDVGLDASFLKDRITIIVDYYQNNNNNLILSVPTARSLGVPNNTIAENIGALYNHGYEFAISSKNILNKSFTWTTDLNLSFNKSKITELYNGQDIIYSASIYRVGLPRNENYLYQSAGVNPANGNPLFIKANGQMVQGNIPNTTYYNYDPKSPGDLSTPTSLVSTDRKPSGTFTPTFFGSVNNMFTYKNFDLTLYFVFSGGNKILNGDRAGFLTDNSFENTSVEILNRWTTPGQITNVPRLYSGGSAFHTASTAYLESGAFIRAQQLKLGYSFPSYMIHHIGLNKVHLYAAADNAFLITKYKGLDPELSGGSNPKARTITIGLNVGL